MFCNVCDYDLLLPAGCVGVWVRGGDGSVHAIVYVRVFMCVCVCVCVCVYVRACVFA